MRFIYSPCESCMRERNINIVSFIMYSVMNKRRPVCCQLLVFSQNWKTKLKKDLESTINNINTSHGNIVCVFFLDLVLVPLQEEQCIIYNARSRYVSIIKIPKPLNHSYKK